jgi:chromosome segregation ATPase
MRSPTSVSQFVVTRADTAKPIQLNDSWPSKRLSKTQPVKKTEVRNEVRKTEPRVELVSKNKPVLKPVGRNVTRKAEPKVELVSAKRPAMKPQGRTDVRKTEPKADLNALRIQLRLQKVKDRLQKLEEEDRDFDNEWATRLQKAKQECKEQLFKLYAPLVNPERKPEAALVADSAKMISYLREENRQLREQIKVLQVSMRELEQQNVSLEKANAAAEEARKDMEGHVATLQSVNDKLTRNVEAYKANLQTAKAEYQKRNAHYLVEAQSRQVFEKVLLGKILPHMEQHCRNATLVQDVKASIAQGEKMVQAGLISVKEQYKMTSLPELIRADTTNDDSDEYDSDEE